MPVATQALEAGRRRRVERPISSRPIQVTIEDEKELCEAIEKYQQASGRMFPTCCEIHEILLSLGYAKRIWKPVEVASFFRELSIVGAGETSPPGDVIGWFARVETQVDE